MNLMSFKTLTIGLTLLLSSFAASARADEKAASDRARRLVEDLRRDLRPLEEQIRNHPYMTALESGQVSRENLKAFAGEQYNIIQSDLKSAAQLVSRYGTTPGGQFFKGILDGEVIALGLLLDFAEALGLDEEDLKAYEPRPRAQTYPSYVTWLSVHGSDADVATAFLVNFAVFGENTGRMGAALRSRYGFTAEETAFFTFFGSLPPDFETDALAAITAGLERGAEPRAIRRAARLLQAYEKDFWDAVAKN